MKKLVLNLIFIVCSVLLFGQNENPFSQFGYDAPVMKVKEPVNPDSLFFVINQDSTSNFGWLIIDTRNRLIHMYSREGLEIDQDTLLSYTTARWLVPDPAGQFNSPYLGMGNNPVSGVDPDGSWWYTDNTTGGQVWTSGFFGNLGGIFSSRYSLNTGTITDAGGSHFVIGDIYKDNGQNFYVPCNEISIVGIRGSKMSVSAAGLDFIAKWEGSVLKPYKDVAGLWTIGIGHLIKDGESFNEITQEEAIQLLKMDARTAELAVQKYVTVPLTQNQYDALVSFTYNLGSGNLKSSSLVRGINSGDMSNVETNLMKWNKARVNGQLQPVLGLTNRRQAEANLFIHGVY